MSLKDYLSIQDEVEKIELTENKVMEILPHAESYISFWREYPDLFVDFLKGPNSNFNLYFYQRVMLRANCRYKYTFMSFPRAYSKSFMVFLSGIIKCILYPGLKLFAVSSTKEQISTIAKEKIDELISLIPGLANEIDYRPGKTTFQRDYVKIVFKNKSAFDIVALKESTRGGRRHGGIIEEVILIDGQLFNSVILPLMNVSRKLANGLPSDQNSPINKSQNYVTTAGWRNTYAYDKMLQLLMWQVLYKDKALVLGGSWRIPVLEKLLDKSFVNDIKSDETYDEGTFIREYESIWAGASEDAFFSADVFDHNRTIQRAEYAYSNNIGKTGYYVLGIDIGRKSDNAVIVVIKVNPQGNDDAIKNVVNIYSYNQMHFEDLCIEAKRIFKRFKPRMMVVDGNGMGTGFVDYLVKDQIDPVSGELLPNMGIANDEPGIYKQFKTKDTILDSVYVIKATAQLNTEMHAHISNQMRMNKIKFLIDEREAKERLLGLDKGQKMSLEQRAEELRPYVVTSIMKEELLNLRQKNEGFNIILEQVNKKIRKDKFSALEYALWYIKQEEDKHRKRKKIDLKKMIFFN